MKKHLLWLTLLLTGCAGFSRSCSSFNATNFGSDWVVVQHKNDGTLYKCWILNDAAIISEHQSDGIYWESQDGHLIHLSGWYTRVQVKGRQFSVAAREIGVDIGGCEP